MFRSLVLASAVLLGHSASAFVFIDSIAECKSPTNPVIYSIKSLDTHAFHTDGAEDHEYFLEIYNPNEQVDYRSLYVTIAKPYIDVQDGIIVAYALPEVSDFGGYVSFVSTPTHSAIDINFSYEMVGANTNGVLTDYSCTITESYRLDVENKQKSDQPKQTQANVDPSYENRVEDRLQSPRGY